LLSLSEQLSPFPVCSALVTRIALPPLRSIFREGFFFSFFFVDRVSFSSFPVPRSVFFLNLVNRKAILLPSKFSVFHQKPNPWCQPIVPPGRHHRPHFPLLMCAQVTADSTSSSLRFSLTRFPNTLHPFHEPCSPSMQDPHPLTPPGPPLLKFFPFSRYLFRHVFGVTTPPPLLLIHQALVQELGLFPTTMLICYP